MKQNIFVMYIQYNSIHMYSGITSGRVLDGELLYTKILEVNMFAFAYRLFHRDFSPINGTLASVEMYDCIIKNLLLFIRDMERSPVD